MATSNHNRTSTFLPFTAKINATPTRVAGTTSIVRRDYHNMDLLKLEQQRQALEVNLQKLRQSLKHWQTWEAEYEGLKEAILDVDGTFDAFMLSGVVNSYDGELVNEKVVLELSGLDKGSPRTPAQIVGLIERRQDYVQKNIETVQRQFFDAEAKSEELAFAARDSSSGAEGLPLTEIQEELDEEDNVISSQLSRPEEYSAQVVDSLRKAGLSEDDLSKVPRSKPKVDELKPAITNASPVLLPGGGTLDRGVTSSPPKLFPDEDESEDLDRPSIRKKSVSFSADTKPPPEPLRPESEDGRKSVSFAEKVAVMRAAPPADTRSVSFSAEIEEIPAQTSVAAGSPAGYPMNAANVNDVISKAPSGSSELPASHAGHDETGSANFIVPENESTEDAQLRREMLQYHLDEVNNIVAQIDLDGTDADMYDDDNEDDEVDDSSSHYTTSEYHDEDDTPYTTGLSDSDESEDEFGRTKRRGVSSEHSQQMASLQARLIGNLGPDTRTDSMADTDPELSSKDVRKLVIRNKRASTSSASSDASEKKSSSKKRVSFAESLDDAEPGSPPIKAQKHELGENVAPMSSIISERSTHAVQSAPHASSIVAPTASGGRDDLAFDGEDERTVSSFGPPKITLIDQPAERVRLQRPAKAPSLDNPDPVMERRELAADYHRRRNDIIRQQGGFQATPDEDDTYGQLMEDRDGKLKKVSRFKAARLKS